MKQKRTQKMVTLPARVLLDWSRRIEEQVRRLGQSQLNRELDSGDLGIFWIVGDEIQQAVRRMSSPKPAAR